MHHIEPSGYARTSAHPLVGVKVHVTLLGFGQIISPTPLTDALTTCHFHSMVSLCSPWSAHTIPQVVANNLGVIEEIIYILQASLIKEYIYGHASFCLGWYSYGRLVVI